MVGQELGLCLRRLGPLLLQYMCDTPVQLLPLAPQQRAVGRVLDQRVFEEEGGLRRGPPAECDTEHGVTSPNSAYWPIAGLFPQSRRAAGFDPDRKFAR